MNCKSKKCSKYRAGRVFGVCVWNCEPRFSTTVRPDQKREVACFMFMLAKEVCSNI